jgi:hypothetical protein
MNDLKTAPNDSNPPEIKNTIVVNYAGEYNFFALASSSAFAAITDKRLFS